jgi:hypothetical protein
MTFGTERKYAIVESWGNIRLMNYWGGGLNLTVKSPRLEVNELRGGPAMYNPMSVEGHYFIGTDYRKKVHGYFGNYISANPNKEAIYAGAFIGMEMRPFDWLGFDLEMRYSKNIDKNQYVTNVDDFQEIRYIRSRFDQQEIDLTLRATLNITPEFTLQYYGMPFLSVGRYGNFAFVADPRAKQLSERVSYYSPQQIRYSAADEVYEIDENLNGSVDYRFDTPDFNMRDFNSNFVLRWEYKAGSVLYLVWTQSRFEWSNQGPVKLDRNVKDLLDIHPHNVLMVKISYRFGV